MLKKPLIAIILVALLIVIGGISWCVGKKQGMVTQPSSVQIDNKDAENETLTYAQQLNLKFSLDILRFWGITEVFQYSKDPQIFYFVSNAEKSATIMKFDTGKVDNYLQNQSVNFPAYVENIFLDKFYGDLELRGVGFDGDKFVFAKTNKGNSPGPCFSSWFYGDLSYIETNTALAVRNPYFVSEQKLMELKEEERRCRETL